MRKLTILWMSLLLTVQLSAQADYSPVPLYWKTLNSEEKEVYLFALSLIHI